MYEFHGWIKIAESPSELDKGGLGEIIASIQNHISGMKQENCFYLLRALNGEYVLHLAGNFNRPRNHHQDVLTLLGLIAKIAPGSFGLLFWKDDEDNQSPGQLYYRVKVLVRGQLRDEVDSFLSPTIPIVED